MSIPSQALRGLVGQGMSGRRARPTFVFQAFPASPSAQTFTCPFSGWYEVAGWGPGTVSTSSVTASGAFVYRLVFLAKGQALSIAVGRANANVTPGGGSSGANSSTVITFPDGTTMTATAATAGAAAPSPSGTYDYGVSGTAGTTNAVAAPSYTSAFGSIYTGGQPEATTGKGGAPGGGAGNAVTTCGADGLVLVNIVFR